MQVALERLLDRDRDPLGAVLETAGSIRSRGRGASGRLAGEHGAEIEVGERGELADGRHAGRGEALLGARPDPWERPDGERREEARPVPAGTTVTPPGLRRSEATFATTLVGATRAQESFVAARTEVCTASATARARV